MGLFGCWFCCLASFMVAQWVFCFGCLDFVGLYYGQVSSGVLAALSSGLL